MEMPKNFIEAMNACIEKVKEIVSQDDNFEIVEEYPKYTFTNSQIKIVVYSKDVHFCSDFGIIITNKITEDQFELPIGSSDFYSLTNLFKSVNEMTIYQKSPERSKIENFLNI